VAIIFLYTTNSANAKCNFEGLKLGDDISKVGERNNVIEIEPSIVSVFMGLRNACPGENLGYSIINITFIEDKLASFTISVGLDINNSETKKRLLYKYVEQNYGKINSSKKPSDWTGFKVWRKGEKTIVYKKMYDLGSILEEELFITNKEYQIKLSEFNSE